MITEGIDSKVLTYVIVGWDKKRKDSFISCWYTYTGDNEFECIRAFIEFNKNNYTGFSDDLIDIKAFNVGYRDPDEGSFQLPGIVFTYNRGIKTKYNKNMGRLKAFPF